MERAKRLSRSTWLSADDRAALKSLAEDLTREEHLLDWVLGAKATCEPYLTGWERDCQPQGTHVNKPPEDKQRA